MESPMGRREVARPKLVRAHHSSKRAGAPRKDPGPTFWAPTEVLVLHLGIGKECSLGLLSSAQGSGIKTVGVLAFTLQPYTKPNRGDTLHPNCRGHQEPEPPITGPRPLLLAPREPGKDKEPAPGRLLSPFPTSFPRPGVGPF